MGGNGKSRRWRMSFHRSSPASAAPPPEFLCPISKSLMFDPAVVSSGQTFERMSVQVCADFGFTPTLPDGTKPNFSAVIPNLALKTAILNWCSKSGCARPVPPIYSDIESSVCSMMDSSKNHDSPVIRDSERELLNGVIGTPPILFSHAASELNPRNLYSSSSSDESVVANTTAFALPFTTRPSYFSASSSPSTSSDFISEDASSNIVSGSSSISSAGEDEYFVNKLQSLDVYEQEQAVISLREITRTNEEARAGLCAERLLCALKQGLISKYTAVQTNATASLVNLSIEKCNKIKIVRAGIVPLLIDILRNGFDESREHAAGAIFSLAMEDENRTTIGVLGALPPLLHALRSNVARCRLDSALALYHLTLVQINMEKTVKLGAVGVLLGLLKDAEVAARVVLVVCNLATCEAGRAALMDAGGVQRLVEIVRNVDGIFSESTRDNCVAALYSVSLGSSRFKGLARDAGAVEVLQKVAETGSERAMEKARRILEDLRGGETVEDGEEVDWEAVMKGRVSRAGFRVGRVMVATRMSSELFL